MYQKLRNRFRLYRKLKKINYRGEAELLLIPFLLRGGSSIDVGANKGVYSLVMSKHGRKVLSLEANSDFTRHLGALPDNCEVVFCAAGEQEATGTLYIPRDDAGKKKRNVASLIRDEVPDGDIEELRVPVRPLDEVAAGYDDIQLIKIDVEGHELAVLKGATSILSKQKPALIVECLSDAKEREIVDYLSGYGYLPFLFVDQRLQHRSMVDARELSVERNIIFLPTR